MKNYIAAIDLGTTKIVALIGEKTESGHYRIVASCEFKSAGIVRGEIENLQDITVLIKKSVSELKKASELEFSEVYVGITGQHIRCLCESVTELRNDETLLITQEEIDALKQKMYSLQKESNEEIIHVIPQSYSVDDKMEIRKPVGMRGRELTGNYHIVIGKTAAINDIKQCLQSSNLKLSGLILQPVASAAAVLTDNDREIGVAVVDIGGGTTGLVIYHDNIIRHAALIPFGGNNVTADIKEGCGIPEKTAESIKIQRGSCFGDASSNNTYIPLNEKKEISPKDLSEIINARMNEIFGGIMFEIEQSGFADKLNAGIIFTGGGSMLKNFTELAESRIGMRIRIGEPVDIGSDSGQELDQPLYSTAAGLIIEGMAHADSIQKESLKEETPVIVKPPVQGGKHKKQGKSIWDGFKTGILFDYDKV
ncbi:MAG: cell division protein FtsA [Prevotellaceae bacterium]|jgi:cell division protein FtsA|nr:cell division protein FtsA [Prevotellaceae bacterium]